jgi:hypothetical protein
MELRDMTIRAIERDYLKACENIAKAAREAVKRGEEADIDEAIHECVSASEWVIYTYRARLVAVLTDHPDAIHEAGFEGAEYTAEGRAYWSMRADVQDYLEVLAEQDAEETNEAPA